MKDLESEYYLKKGDIITCYKCEDPVYIVAVERIEFRAKVESKNFTHPDGRPVEYMTALQCLTCGANFSSISSIRKTTTLYVEQPLKTQVN